MGTYGFQNCNKHSRPPPPPVVSSLTDLQLYISFIVDALHTRMVSMMSSIMLQMYENDSLTLKDMDDI